MNKIFLILITISVGLSYLECSSSEKETLFEPKGGFIEILPNYKKIDNSISTDADIIKAATLYLNSEKPNWHNDFILSSIEYDSKNHLWFLFYDSRGVIIAVYDNNNLTIEHAKEVGGDFSLFISAENHTVKFSQGA